MKNLEDCLKFNEMMSDYWVMIRDKDRIVREKYSDIYFDGLYNNKDKDFVCRLDYINCCYEKALRYKK